MPRLYPGLVSITFRKLTVEEILTAVQQSPLEGIEWGGDVHVPHGDLKTAKRVGRLTREAGLSCFCYGTYYRFRDVNPEAAERGPSFECILDTAEALGAPRIRLWAGEKDFDQCDEGSRAQLAESAHRAAELAQKRNLSVDFEFHGGTLNNTAENSLNWMQSVDHPNAKTLWQPLPSIPEENREGGLRALLPHVSNIHCYHWGPKGFSDRRALFEGTEEWRPYLNVLAKSQLNRWIAIEFVKDDSLEQFHQDSISLKEWITHQGTNPTD